jgi:hypothetical protein
METTSDTKHPTPCSPTLPYPSDTALWKNCSLSLCGSWARLGQGSTCQQEQRTGTGGGSRRGGHRTAGDNSSDGEAPGCQGPQQSEHCGDHPCPLFESSTTSERTVLSPAMLRSHLSRDFRFTCGSSECVA